jgi:thiamine-phosphate diphosphorylase
MSLTICPVYPLTATTNRHGLSHSDLAARLISGGASWIQFRGKDLSDRDLYREALRTRSVCRDAGATLIVNDRIDLALATEADGVHLGQTDLPPDVARRLLGAKAIIGLSTHTREEFLRAQGEDVNYLAIGPIFSTRTKASDYPPLGLEAVASLVGVSRFPVIAIGGITWEVAPELWKRGITSVAVISDIVNAEDPSDRVRQYLLSAKTMRNSPE